MATMYVLSQVVGSSFPLPALFFYFSNAYIFIENVSSTLNQIWLAVTFYRV